MRRHNNKRPVSSSGSKWTELTDDASQPKATATPAEASQDPVVDPLSSLVRLLARQAARECIEKERADSPFSLADFAQRIPGAKR